MSAVLNLKQLELTKSEVIYGVSWETYEFLVEKYRNQQTPRLTYDSGIMEVEMSNSLKHEEDNRNLAALFEAIALELELEFRRCGSTTFKRQTISKGFEPDSGYFIETLKRIDRKEDLDFKIDPSPDLTIEVNRTSSSLPRMPVFAAFGVKEVWRVNKNIVKFYVLEKRVYVESENSPTIPFLTSQKATELLSEINKLGNIAWTKKIRNWVKEANK